MIILLSPAKTLDMESPSRIPSPTYPDLLDESEKLVRTLKRYRKGKLSELMNISESLASVNVERYSNWQPEADTPLARPAIQAFRGDVYTGLDSDSLSKRDLAHAQKHVRILSGLYGVLRPFDLMQAYRLEMGTRLKTRRGKNLYEFWGSRITAQLNDELAAMSGKLYVNLASDEYFKSVRKQELTADLVSPVFRDEKNGDYKVISFFAKKARGSMARHLIQCRAKSQDDIQSFQSLGYRYNKKYSKPEAPVFLRTEKAAKPYLA